MGDTIGTTENNLRTAGETYVTVVLCLGTAVETGPGVVLARARLATPPS